MLKALSIQIQPERAPELNVAEVKRSLEAITKSTLVRRHDFNEGFDETRYLNFTFGTEDLRGLWSLIQSTIFGDAPFAEPLARASIIVCEGNDGWNDYLQLFHFDPSLPRDSIDAT
jgi:hypothetical protein